MAKEYSFDVISTVDLQEVTNAVQHAKKLPRVTIFVTVKANLHLPMTPLLW